MTQSEVELLLAKYRLGQCTQEEKDAIENWYEETYHNSTFLWDIDIKDNFKKSLDEKIFPALKINNEEKKAIPIFKYLAAASLVGIVLSSIFIWKNKSNKTKNWAMESQAIRYQNNINPGTVGAEWTINNTAFVLDGKNKILQNNGKNIGTQTPDELILEDIGDTYFESSISTKNGQQYKIVLNDGTKVWLNAASSIHFKMPFENNKRDIFLTGEAYFEVTPDAKKPFRVISDKDTITVLGTHFNINAYKDEPNYAATLLEGKITYSSPFIQDSNRYILLPNDVLTRTDQIILKSHHDDADNHIAWKDGYFSFSNDDIHTVMRQLARWYNIEVDYKNENYNEKFYGDLRKDASLTSILSVLEKSGVKFLIQGTKVTVL